MTDKRKFGTAYGYRGVSARQALRERLLDLCERLLVLVAFLVFLSFVQSVTATQQELDSSAPARQSSSAFRHLGLGDADVHTFKQQAAGSAHAHA